MASNGDPNMPPREAAKQADGSYVHTLEDGSTMRYTRRPNGIWRKPEHKRAGWVGELEQKAYVSKGAQVEQIQQAAMCAQLGRIPGSSPDYVAPEGNKTQAQMKNERKKEKRKENAEEKLEVARGAAPEAKKVVAAEAVPQQDGDGKNEKALRKKLRQIEELVEKQKGGEALNEAQLAKVASKNGLEADLQAVLAGEPASTTAPAVSKAPAAPVAGYVATAAAPAAAATVVAAVAAPAATAPSAAAPVAEAASASKSKKAIEKKLRQIAEIEEKERNGEVLNEDQRQKLAAKKELQKELAA